MPRKLTLKLDDAVIDKAKEYAAKHNSSISKLVEEYFRSLTSSESDKMSPITPSVKKLSGILQDVGEIDLKKEKMEYLTGKHSL